MKYLSLGAGDFAKRAQDARIDIQSIVELQKLPRPVGDASFMIEKQLYVWVDMEATPHDGRAFISPDGSGKFTGRYCLATIGRPLSRNS